MNPDPRLCLSARRPCGKDDKDPAIQEALSQCDCDPKLAEWAEAERCEAACICAKVKEVPPPAGLRERILSCAQLRRSGWRAWFERKVWRSFRNGELLAVAALVLLFATAITFRPKDPAAAAITWKEAAAVEVAAIERAGSTDPLDHVVSDLPQIRAWLAEQTCPSPATLPPAVRDLKIYGCAKRIWRGQPLSIVCFALEGGREIHLVTIDRKHLPASPPERRPEFAEVRGYQTASWSEGSVAMMLIGKVELAELQKFFGSTAARVWWSNPLIAFIH